jgi:tRNA pseudouridine38-40 synthase
LKTRYFIFLSYKGTSYHGWQVQPDSPTVQETLEKSLSLLLGEKIETTGAGRTDAGVHASFFCAHFDSSVLNLQNDKNLKFRLNRFLPKDISVNDIRKVRHDANARFSALSRTYKYYISTVKDPFKEDLSWFLYGELDLQIMNLASDELLKHTDFTSFSRLHTDVKTNNCRIFAAEWTREGPMLVFTIRADRFLRNMVRAIVGTMVDAGRGKISPSMFAGIIASRNRSSAGISAPAKGLFLTDIEYPPEVFLK